MKSHIEGFTLKRIDEKQPIQAGLAPEALAVNTKFITSTLDTWLPLHLLNKYLGLFSYRLLKWQFMQTESPEKWDCRCSIFFTNAHSLMSGLRVRPTLSDFNLSNFRFIIWGDNSSKLHVQCSGKIIIYHKVGVHLNTIENEMKPQSPWHHA